MPKSIDMATAREIVRDFREVCRRCDPAELASLDDDADAVRAQTRLLVRWRTGGEMPTTCEVVMNKKSDMANDLELAARIETRAFELLCELRPDQPYVFDEERDPNDTQQPPEYLAALDRGRTLVAQASERLLREFTPDEMQRAYLANKECGLS
jgi:hypothetical protein